MSVHKVRALDGKYSIALDDDDGCPVIINTQTGVPIPDSEPVFVLRGKDALTPVALQNYAALLSVAQAARGDDSNHFETMAKEVLDHAKLIEAWQADQGGARLPD